MEKSYKKNIAVVILPWLIWLVATTLYAHLYFLRISVNGIENTLAKNFQMTAIELSGIAGSFYYAYILAQIPTGFLLDHFGPRKVLVSAGTLTTIACILFAKANNLAVFEFSRALMGIAAAFVATGALKLIRSWFDERYFACLNGILAGTGALGAILGGPVLTSLLTEDNWRTIFLMAGLISFALALGVFFIIRDVREGTNQIIQAKGTMLKHAKKVFFSWPVWSLSFFSGMVFVPITVLGALWLTLYLEIYYGQENFLIETASVMVFIGFSVGSVVLGFLAGFWGHTKKIMLSFSLVCLLAFSSIVYVPQIPVSAMSLLLFIMGFGCAAVSLNVVVIGSYIEQSENGTAFAVINFFKYFIGALFLPLIGFMLDKGWDVSTAHRRDIFTVADYQYAFTPLVVGILIGIMVLLLLTRKGKP